ncbi:magnesium/cobalt transporter CorA [Conexibacter sp. JD483]|uniref:magnesium/cobalt transporter CorA n=1 Tax=unclassified Conexibacter TaxID=2627773 RepID=UPI002722702F|nr:MULTISPECIES: magnesium/cobalt transporter CorA [unclassified Conexibacter]MDO8187161.1 magnesium/cobalt transporter CorA [Conexibacter sp. CPCC 205706]MDO8200337.1 magnesium/cobalt transporter CorA [Conexibacter sp. CPCC 205762]MDR9368867.1 magnesium/cobalt transporter CorA [Conexibacter sp. JD483]
MHILDAIDEQLIERLLVERHFFWLDVVHPSDEQLSWLGERFGWHPLAIEDTREFRQRPKLDRYGDHMLLVFYGAQPIDSQHRLLEVPDEETARRKLVEVHLLVSGNWVVTVRRDWCGAVDDLRARMRKEREPESESFVIYRILDALTDTFFPLLEAIDDTIDTLEDAIILDATDRQLQGIFKLKRALAALRRIVTPQRDLAQRAIEDINDLPGLDVGTRDYFRDVYDHLIRVSDLVDSYRDLLTGLMDVYLSTASNRMNQVMKQLTLVSTVFLPVTALTGFFGMNFGWLVRHIDSVWSFMVFGVGGAAVAAVGLFIWFKRARFFD